MKTKKMFWILAAGLFLTVLALIVSTKTNDSDVTLFCERKLVGVPEWLDVSEPENGLAPGATASGLLAIRAQQYIQKHDGIESFEITEAGTGKKFVSYDSEKERIESADNGGAHILIGQIPIDEGIAQVAMTIKRDKTTDPSKVEAIYASIEGSDFYWDPSTEWCFEPRQVVQEKPDALNYNMKEDEHLYAWTDKGVMLQACYNGYIYISGRSDPVCVMASTIVKTEIEDTFAAIAYDIHERQSNIPSRDLVYCDGFIGRENIENGQMEVCPWYADKITWEDTNYYPRLSSKRGDNFVFVPEGTSEFKYGDKSIFANMGDFELVEYDRLNQEWYVRCRLTGAGNPTAIYGDNEINVVASDCGLFVISPTSISLIEGISTVNVEDGIYVYDKKTMKRLTLDTKFTDGKLELTKKTIEEIKAGSLLNHPLKTILEFSQGDPADLVFPETTELYILRTDGMNKEEWPYNNEHAEIKVAIGKILLRWSTLSY